MAECAFYISSMSTSSITDRVLSAIVSGYQQPLTDSSLEELFLICAASSMDDESDDDSEASLSIAIDCDEDVNWIAIDIFDDRGILSSETYSVDYRRVLSNAEGGYVLTELMGQSEDDDEVFEHEVYVTCEFADVLHEASDSLVGSLNETEPSDGFHAELKNYCLVVLSEI